MAKKIQLSLIIPAFNEEERLPKKFSKAFKILNKNFKKLEIIFVNDGSTDKTEKVLQKLVSNSSDIRLISYQNNRGKGYAIRKGVEIAQGEVVGFTDADFAVDVEGIKQAYEVLKKDIDIVIGDRNSNKSKLENKPNFKRRLFGSLLSLMNKLFLPLNEISDSQNGFKFFKRNVAKDIFPKLTINRWLFDMQLLSVAISKGYKIKQQPVIWEEIGESKVNVLKDLPQVCWDLSKMYFQHMNVRFFSLILSLLLLVLLAPFLLHPESLTQRNGNYSDLVWPDYYFIKQSILTDHQIPFWNPTLFSGIPEIANPQSPLIYPPNALALFLPIDLAIVIIYFFHGLMAGIFFFKLTREKFKWSILGSVAATFTFIFSSFFWSKIAVGHLSQIFAIFLTAPILYFGFVFLQTKKWSYLFLTALVLALQYLNYPTIWYFTNLFTVIFLLGAFWKKLLKFNWQIFLTPILSLVIIAPIFLLQLQAGPLITRSILNFNDLAIPVWSAIRFIKSILIPSNLLGDNETEVWLYPSLAALILSFWGFLKLNKKYHLVFGFLIILLILITLGGRTPIFGLLTRYFPGFSYLRVSTRDWFVFITLVAILAGWAIEKMGSRIRKITFAILLADLLFFSAIRIWFVPSFMNPATTLNLRDLFRPSTEYRTYCTSRCLSARDSLPAGIITADGYHLLILQNYRLAISQAGGFKPPEYTGNLPTYNVSEAQPSALELGKFGVKWVLSNHQLDDQNFKPVQNENGYTLFENQKAQKRFFFQNQTANQIQVIKDTADQIILKTSGQADTLVVADSFYPGWEAYIDQKQVTIKKEAGWARSVQVGNGNHQVEFIFKPFAHIFDR